jgi:predicted enzyme related to lactoylglutathione lyase
VGTRTSYDPGLFCWVDLSTNDAEAAKDFYPRLFGWEYQEGEVVWMATLDGQRVAAIIGNAGDRHPAWVPYFATADLDASVATVGELGGQTFGEPREVPAGRFVVAADPQLAAFCLFEGEFDD